MTRKIGIAVAEMNIPSGRLAVVYIDTETGEMHLRLATVQDVELKKEED